MDELSVFAERFKDLLSENGLKPTKLAYLLGIPKNTICRYARGFQLPNLKMATMLADYFDCGIDYLLGRTDERKSVSNNSVIPFTTRFQDLMKEFGTNKYRISKATDLHPSILYRWQSGQCSPELDSLIILANYFDCSVEYILGRINTAW